MARKKAVKSEVDSASSRKGKDEVGVDGAERPTSPRGALVRHAMLSAAADLFAERGFGGTNLRDLADVLGMSRPGLYYHFPSKEKILEALIEEVTFSFAEQLKTITSNVDQDPEAELRHVVKVSTLWVLENSVMFRVLDRSESDMPKELKEKHNASKRVILEHFTDIIQRGIAVGKFRPVDPHVAGLTISGMRNWGAWWFKPEGRLRQHEIAEMVAEMAVRSLLRPDAHRSRSDRIGDVMRILKEDVAHLDHLLSE